MNDNAGERLTPLDVLRRDGWCKGSFHDMTGAYCIRGAGHQCRITSGHPYLLAVGEVAREQFPERIPADLATDRFTSNDVVRFNDHPDTTFADVEAVLEKAQLRLAEQVR